MKHFLKIIVASVVAALALSVGIIIARESDATTGDWLSLAGSLIGAGVTVAGSLALLEWQRMKEVRGREDLLADSLRDTILLTHGYHAADEPALQLKTGRSVENQTLELRRSIKRLLSFRSWMTPDSVAVLRAFDEIEAIRIPYDDLEDGLGWKHVSGADLGGLNATGHQIASIANEALRKLSRKTVRPY